jgi:hypothetical protein
MKVKFAKRATSVLMVIVASIAGSATVAVPREAQACDALCQCENLAHQDLLRCYGICNSPGCGNCSGPRACVQSPCNVTDACYCMGSVEGEETNACEAYKQGRTCGDLCGQLYSTEMWECGPDPLP